MSPTKTGPQFRLGQVRHVFEFIPPMTMQSVDPITGLATSPPTPICGKCFRGLGDDPFDGKPGKMPAGAAKDERCFRCGHRCHPFD